MLRALFCLLGLMLLSGCQLGYYTHLAQGHWQLMSSATPVAQVLEAAETDEQLKARLQVAQSALQFAESSMALPVDGTYEDYAALDRDYVVWNLVAAPALSLTPTQWCYPVVGCASYRGFFDLQRAASFRADLEQQDLDVYGSGAIAYSTLGWFDDPLTSLMIEGDPAWVAQLIFHELVHRRLYVKGDTRFNESLATAVAREGRRRWQAQFQEVEGESKWSAHQRAAEEVQAWIQAARSELEVLYASALPDQEKLAGKARVQEALRARYYQAVEDDAVFEPWQSWFDGPLNNAQLALRQDYLGAVPAFDALLLDCGGDMECFWESVDQVAALPHDERQQWIEDRIR